MQRSIAKAAFSAFLLFGLGCAVLYGCPQRAIVSHCTPGTTSCSEDGTQPFVCSSTRRLQPTADEPCPTGTSCCLVTSIEGGQVHACAVAADCVEPLPGGAYEAPAAPAFEGASQ